MVTNPLQQQVDRHHLTQQLVAHALNVSSDCPVHDDDGEFLGHWQDEAWIKTLLVLARKLAEIEGNNWRTNYESLHHEIRTIEGDMGGRCGDLS